MIKISPTQFPIPMTSQQTPRRNSVLLPLSLALTLCATPHTRAETYWFRGATNGNLGTASNWATDDSGTASTTLPTANDDIVFSVTANNNTALNRWSMGGGNRAYASLTLSNSGINYILRISDAGTTNTSVANMTLSAGITNASTAGAFFLGDTDRRVPLRIAAGAGDFVIANNSASAVTLLDTVSLQTANTTNRTLRVDGTGTGSVFFNSGIANGGGSGAVLSLRISNTGAVSIAGSTFTGGTILDAGTIALAAGSALGTGPLVINGGAIGSVTSARTIANAIVVGGDFSLGVTNAGFNSQSTTFNGDVDLGGASRTITMIANSATINGAITNGALIVDGGSVTRNLALGGANTISSLAVTAANLQIANDAALGAGSLTLSNASLSASGGDRAVANAIVLNGDLGLNNTGGANLLTIAADLDLGSSARTLTASNSSVISGIISGVGGSLIKAGSGTLTLASGNTYSDGTDVIDGTFVVNNTTGSGTGSGVLTISNGATLMGSGTISGATTISGIHSPGNSPGLQTFGSDLTYNTGSSVNWDLAGNTADPVARGVSYDGVNVAGDLAFNGTVSLDLIFNSTGSTVNWADALWTSNQQWTIYAVAGTTTGFPSFQLATANWADSEAGLFDTLLSGSSFALAQDGQNIVLNYAVPEPSTYALLGLGTVALAVCGLRRRKRAGH